MLTEPESDDGSVEMDNLLAELEKENLPEESDIVKNEKPKKVEKPKKDDDTFGVDNMEEYEALADVDKEQYGI